ncbi:MAG: hypothetical protein GY822_03825 [Deltaproteobacteria bacterium]|nr:hypothetical protein [Deltaproteobacteria bacterium]
MAKDINTAPLDSHLLEEAGVPSETIEAFETHFQLLLRWNKVHNLTRVTHSAEATRKHYLDSWLGTLEVEGQFPKAPWENGLWDIGSGAGFPGIACALRWKTPMVWVEPSSKRVSFLTLVKQELDLGHVEIQNGRLEDMPQEGLADGLMISRATFPWQNWRPHLLKHPVSHLALWCGKDPTLQEWQAHLQEMSASETWIGSHAVVEVPHTEFRQILFASPKSFLESTSSHSNP